MPCFIYRQLILLTTDNTGVLLVRIPIQMPNWLRQGNSQSTHTQHISPSVLRTPKESHPDRGAGLSLPGTHGEDLNIRNPALGCSAQPGLLVAPCGISLFSPHPFADVPPKSIFPLHSVPITSAQDPLLIPKPCEQLLLACSVTISSEFLQHSHANKEIKPVNL